MNIPVRDSTYRRVLIVDDEKPSRTMVDRAIRKLWPHIKIAQANDGIQAVRVAKEFLPDILVLDLMLPGQDGFAVLNEFKDHPQLQSTLVLGMTAYNTPENLKKIVKNGAISCLIKPFGPEDLKIVLSPYLDLGNGLEDKSQSNAGLTVEKIGEKKKVKGLVSVVAFISLFMSLLKMQGTAEGGSSQMTKNSTIEEVFKSNRKALIEKIAIAPFESFGRYVSGKMFSETLSECLIKKIENLEVIERADIEKILSEQKFSLTGAVRQDKQIKIGEIEPIDAIITGSVRTLGTFTDEGGAIRVSVKIIDVRSGKILWRGNQEIVSSIAVVEKEILAEELMDEAANKIAKKIKSFLKHENKKVLKNNIKS